LEPTSNHQCQPHNDDHPTRVKYIQMLWQNFLNTKLLSNFEFMELIEISFENKKGTATLIERNAWNGLWKIVVGETYLVIQNNYLRAETYVLIEFSNNISEIKAKEQMPVIMWQVHQAIIANKPKSPKRYR
jgi:hypothetical protein